MTRYSGQSDDSLPAILPEGTAVVIRRDVQGGDASTVHPAGTAGVIARSPVEPQRAYRVRFPGGDEALLQREEFHVLRHYQRSDFDQPLHPITEHNLYEHVIYRCVTGSQAYGLAHEASDVDRRGVYLPPAEMHWSLYGVPEQLENLETEEVYWELEKFLKLALKANPNVLECLYTPLRELLTPLGQELADLREAFLSRLVYQTYNGYAMSQFKKLKQDLRTRGTIKWKHAMHLIRLLLAGITCLREHHVPVRVEDEHRKKLLAIRDGEMAWDEIEAWRQALHRRFEVEFARTTLPERPDYDRVNAFLIRARRSAA